MADSVADVLREMDELSQEKYLDGCRGEVIANWLKVLYEHFAQAPREHQASEAAKPSRATEDKVLADMDRCSRDATSEPFHATPDMVSRWLEVLRPALRSRTWAEELVSRWRKNDATTETFSLKSGLAQAQLRDMAITVRMTVDHEGGGTVELNFDQTPMLHRLQALLQLAGALNVRIELAIGTESYVNLLRGIIAKREREL